ncbi:F-box domain-containing protein [Heracleum sosnowskyi]|uniref:F-box domain-containing protein n=1 Tax=Heracleum sosnowskyi TaxID=360622 RepID=A0AAD8MQP6_9APIA|nr:F-box domain-containing protein [Heracleum sosnowskyi]
MYPLVTNVINKLYSATGSFSQSQNENPIVCESSRKQTCMNDLPEELVIEILLCLPVQSLLRFKVVCREWRSHISNPKFVKRHNVRTTTNPKHDYLIISYNYHYRSSDPDRLCVININPPHRAISLNLPTSISHDNFDVVGSCNGLLCLDYKRSTERPYWRSPTKKLYLWNPATGKAKELPRCNISIMTENYDVSLGFGFDFASSDYKVVRTAIRKKKKDSLENRVEVYSLKKNSWKNIEVDSEFDVGDCWRSSAFVMGSLYWISKKQGYSLLSFNLESENFCIIPSLPAGISCISDIFEFKESVAVRDFSTRKIINIWTLNDDSCWIKKLTINSAIIENKVGYLMTGEFVGLNCDNELVLYDPVNEVRRAIPQHRLHSSHVTTYSYSESLVNLN